MTEAKPRPLSPHLQIYAPQLTSLTSILHRLSGIGLSFGVIVFVAWVAALANGADAYADFVDTAQSFFGQIILLGFTLAFFYHFSNGIRHLLWDAGWGLDIHTSYKTGAVVFVATVLFTTLTWLTAYGVFS